MRAVAQARLAPHVLPQATSTRRGVSPLSTSIMPLDGSAKPMLFGESRGRNRINGQRFGAIDATEDDAGSASPSRVGKSHTILDHGLISIDARRHQEGSPVSIMTHRDSFPHKLAKEGGGRRASMEGGLLPAAHTPPGTAPLTPSPPRTARRHPSFTRRLRPLLDDGAPAAKGPGTNLFPQAAQLERLTSRGMAIARSGMSRGAANAVESTLVNAL